ncbi:DNA mismatch endonuclease Vsr [Rhizobium leguminosarum]|nr:DNA mismatch endonuclease Vsr [Rhizobium leguminosarum]
MDKLTAETRSRVMARVKGRDTEPELKVRRLLRSMGMHYRLHAKELPGCPDIVFRKRKKAIFVHGCFWHGHDDGICKRGKRPETRRDFWDKKLNSNIQRDRTNQDALRSLGYGALVIWECDLKDESAVRSRLQAFLTDSEA